MSSEIAAWLVYWYTELCDQCLACVYGILSCAISAWHVYWYTELCDQCLACVLVY